MTADSGSPVERRIPDAATVQAWVDTKKPACSGGHSTPTFEGWTMEELHGAYRMLGVLSTSPRINGQALALLRCLSVDLAKAGDALFSRG